jgi:hypothetical protein
MSKRDEFNADVVSAFSEADAEIADAMRLTEAILARLRKTCSGETVAFDKLHVLEVILQHRADTAMEECRASDARFTPVEEGKASGSANDLSSPVLVSRVRDDKEKEI